MQPTRLRTRLKQEQAQTFDALVSAGAYNSPRLIRSNQADGLLASKPVPKEHQYGPGTKTERPIGYWLRRADTLLTEQIDKAQAANGVSRFEWQVLNMLNELGSASKERILDHACVR